MPCNPRSLYPSPGSHLALRRSWARACLSAPARNCGRGSGSCEVEGSEPPGSAHHVAGPDRGAGRVRASHPSSLRRRRRGSLRPPQVPASSRVTGSLSGTAPAAACSAPAAGPAPAPAPSGRAPQAWAANSGWSRLRRALPPATSRWAGREESRPLTREAASAPSGALHSWGTALQSPARAGPCLLPHPLPRVSDFSPFRVSAPQGGPP